MSRSDLLKSLSDWVDAGLITGDQAQAIREYESEAHKDDLPGWVEPVAYLGAALIAVALLLFGIQVWDRLATWGQVSVSGLITLVLFGTGVVFRRSDSAPAQRAASFAWLLAVGGVIATSSLIFSNVIDVGSGTASLLSAAVSVVSAVGLYLAARTTLQQIAIAWTGVLLLTSLPEIFPFGFDEAWIIGLLFLAVGVIWMLLTWAGYLAPPTTGWVLGSLSAIAVGIGAFNGSALWPGLGIIVGLALVWLSTRVDRRVLLGLGVLALVIWIPTTVTILFEDSIAVPVAILITGFVTLTVVVAALRLGRRQPKPDAAMPDSGGG